MSLNQLSLRERQCLKYTICGYNVRQIAEKLEIAAATVEYHLLNAKNKWGCKNKLDLVKQAFRKQVFGLPNLEVEEVEAMDIAS